MITQADRWKIASVLLAYPDRGDFAELLSEIRTLAEDAGDGVVLATVRALGDVPHPELVRCYVSTFDMQESMALYLTSHELGDSRERGGALLRLHAMLRSAALEPLEGELPDYLPLLFEFLAEKPMGMPTEDLESRLAVICRGICDRLDGAHPYRPLFQLISACLPDVQTGEKDATQLLSKPGEEPDIDNLPYPLVYE